MNFLLDINSHFEKYKDVLLEKLISYYGEEYRELITSRLNNICFDFSSTPHEDFKYACSHSDIVDNGTMGLVEKKLKLYKKAEEVGRKKLLKEFLSFLQANSKTDISKKILKSESSFISLFSDENFNSGYIDSYSSTSLSLLNNPLTPSCVRESIIRDQKHFTQLANEFHYEPIEPNNQFVDEIISLRNTLKNKFNTILVQKTNFGQSIYDEFYKKTGVKLDSENLGSLAFKSNAWAGTVTVTNNNDRNSYKIIRIPITLHVNKGIKAFDVDLIHEIIHAVETAIETNGDLVGITTHESGANNIANEIRTQKLAIRLTEELHEDNIFIFDNPKDYKVRGTSAYEWLFPISEDFFNKYEDFISSCAITNDLEKMNDFFGSSWEEYSKYVEKIYNEFMEYHTRAPNTKININLDDTHIRLIENMQSHSSNQGGIRIV